MPFYETAGDYSTLMMIPEGVEGTVATLHLMRDLVRSYKKDVQLRGLAMRIVSPCGQKRFMCEAVRIHEWVRDQIRYVGDVTDVETVQTPIQTLTMGGGDCDDKATLVCTLLESIGHATRFVAVGVEPDVYCHVYAETLVGNVWVATDTTEPGNFGWAPPAEMIQAKKTVHN
jgi:hypothetical protein